MSEFVSMNPNEATIPSGEIMSIKADRTCHIFINGRELPECETYAWFEAAIQEKAAREQLDENGLARCGCGGKAAVEAGESNYSGYYVVCALCPCSIGFDRNQDEFTYGEYSTREQARDAWNRAMGYREKPLNATPENNGME